MQNEKGISLLEILLAIMIITFTVAAMMKALDQDLKGQARVRNRLRAGTLARAKLDLVKDYARQAATAGSFRSITLSPLVTSYAVTQSALIDNKAFTWKVSSNYLYMTSGLSVTVDVSSNTVTSKLLKFQALVTWREGSYSKYLTQTAIVSDPSQ